MKYFKGTNNYNALKKSYNIRYGSNIVNITAILIIFRKEVVNKEVPDLIVFCSSLNNDVELEVKRAPDSRFILKF